MTSSAGNAIIPKQSFHKCLISIIFHGCSFTPHDYWFSLTIQRCVWTNPECCGQWHLRTLCHATSAVATITWVATCAQNSLWKMRHFVQLSVGIQTWNGWLYQCISYYIYYIRYTSHCKPIRTGGQMTQQLGWMNGWLTNGRSVFCIQPSLFGCSSSQLTPESHIDPTQLRGLINDKRRYWPIVFAIMGSWRHEIHQTSCGISRGWNPNLKWEMAILDQRRLTWEVPQSEPLWTSSVSA